MSSPKARATGLSLQSWLADRPKNICSRNRALGWEKWGEKISPKTGESERATSGRCGSPSSQASGVGWWVWSIPSSRWLRRPVFHFPPRSTTSPPKPFHSLPPSRNRGSRANSTQKRVHVPVSQRATPENQPRGQRELVPAQSRYSDGKVRKASALQPEKHRKNQVVRGRTDATVDPAAWSWPGNRLGGVVIGLVPPCVFPDQPTDMVASPASQIRCEVGGHNTKLCQIWMRLGKKPSPKRAAFQRGTTSRDRSEP